MPAAGKGGKAREAARYKKATADALALLDWCIEYFEDNRRVQLARQLARNRRRIQERLSDQRRPPDAAGARRLRR